MPRYLSESKKSTVFLELETNNVVIGSNHENHYYVQVLHYTRKKDSFTNDFCGTTHNSVYCLQDLERIHTDESFLKNLYRNKGKMFMWKKIWELLF